MPLGPIEAFYLMLVLLILPAAALVATLVRRRDLSLGARLLDGIRWGAAVALIGLVPFVVLVVIVNVI